MSRSRRNLGTLQAIPENEEQAPRAGPVAEILSLIDDLDAQGRLPQGWAGRPACDAVIPTAPMF